MQTRQHILGDLIVGRDKLEIVRARRAGVLSGLAGDSHFFEIGRVALLHMTDMAQVQRQVIDGLAGQLLAFKSLGE
ncbi:hypothetical protein D3C86_2134590 [compost metagenome]